jgi:hypothetical protein
VAGALCVVAARGQNLDEGKTGPQLFALDCAACHRSAQGLARNYSGWSLTGFLRQHYTSSSGSAGVLAAYLTSAANARAEPKKGKADERQAKQSPPTRDTKAGRTEPAEQPARKQAARPSEAAPDQPGRPGRKTRREPAEAVPLPPPEPTASAPAAAAAAPDGAPGALPAGAAEVADAAQAAAAPAQPGFANPLP